MRILVTGATGFIGAEIVAFLHSQQHSVVCCVRDVAYAKAIFPYAEVLACDFAADIHKEDWLDRLQHIDVIINCAGVLQSSHLATVWNIHYHAPKALFDAAVAVGVKKIIQISALGVDKSRVQFATSKKAADDYLASLPICSVIVRPSLVHGSGSYGGTSLFRGMAALPGVLVVPGEGRQQFQPIDVHELARAIGIYAVITTPETLLVEAVGAEKVTLVTVLKSLRAWLGFKPAKIMKVPLWLVRCGCYLGNFFHHPTINMTTYHMMVSDNTTTLASYQLFCQSIHSEVSGFNAVLMREVSHVQDRWHAKLFFLRPLLRLSLGLVWLGSGFASLLNLEASYALLATTTLPIWCQTSLIIGGSAIDIILGLLTLLRIKLKVTLMVQIIMMVLYMVIISLFFPVLWLDPLASVLKNIVLIISTLIMLAFESER